MRKAVEVHVTGQVQGVSFRWYTREQAQQLGVVGWVRNEPDGSVVLHAEGDAADVDALVDWCRSGPSLAKVRDVALREAAATRAADFVIRH